ncbi:MAG TPA: hypothetical protein VFZ59_04865 [Verrucomicrobiae bacterium]|nr:hypothetical protein [Verrucomicrobiae bacterium]
MKSFKSTSAALLAALGLCSPWAVQNCKAQTDTNLYRARINLVCVSTNANGTLVYDQVATTEFVREFAMDHGVTNFNNLVLAYNRADASLQVVHRPTRQVIGTPLSFDGGTAISNTRTTRVERLTYVYFEGNSVASGVLSATENLTYSKNGQLRTFGFRGSLHYSFTTAANSSVICRGTLTVGSALDEPAAPVNPFTQLLGNGNSNQGGPPP